MTDATDWPKEWVEAVARALCEESGWNPSEPVAGFTVQRWMQYRHHARAALTALAPCLRAERDRVREECANLVRSRAETHSRLAARAEDAGDLVDGFAHRHTADVLSQAAHAVGTIAAREDLARLGQECDADALRAMKEGE